MADVLDSFGCSCNLLMASEQASNQLRQRTSRAAMSLSSLSSALGLSSPEMSGGGKTHKRKESFRGEAFIPSFDASLDGSSISSDGAKSKNQGDPIPALLGEEDSATATGSSSALLSLAVSGSSDAIKELTHGIQTGGQQQQKQGEENALDGDVESQQQEEPQPKIILENVEYVTCLPLASSCTDLSSMDQPITKEMAKSIFSRRIVPAEIPVTAENESDVSTLNGGKHIECDTEGNIEVEDIEKGKAETTTTTTTIVKTEVEVDWPWYHRFLERRSQSERFFLGVILVSGTILIVLLVIVLR